MVVTHRQLCCGDRAIFTGEL